MDRFDFSPLFRSTIGFDRLARLVDSASRFDGAAPSYPPYNIEQTSPTGLRITLAVAGFTMDELQITQEDNQLVIRGRQADEKRRAAGRATPLRAITVGGVRAAARLAVVRLEQPVVTALGTEADHLTHDLRPPHRRSPGRQAHRSAGNARPIMIVARPGRRSVDILRRVPRPHRNCRGTGAQPVRRSLA